MSKKKELLTSMFFLGKYEHIYAYIKELHQLHDFEFPDTVNVRVKDLWHNFKIYLAEIKSLYVIRAFFLVLLYGSVVSGITSSIPILSQVSESILKLSAVVGSTASILSLLLLMKLISTKSGELEATYTHLMSYYVTYEVHHATKPVNEEKSENKISKKTTVKKKSSKMKKSKK